jgi:ceramide glucosyltransferase
MLAGLSEVRFVELAMLAAAVGGGLAASGAALAAGFFTFLFNAASAFIAASLLRRQPPLGPGPFPPVTLIKPLKGEDRELYDNLASFCRQDYPCFQLLFCLSAPDDPALAVVERLRRDFPGVDMETVVSKNRIGYNPKVNNMANAYPFAKYDLLLMSDSDIRVEPAFLQRMAAPFADPGVGLVTSFYQASRSRGVWGHMEALSINAHFLPQAMVAARFGMRFAMGAAMMVRRKAFDATGAFANLGDHLADDFWLGESVREAGWRLELSAGVVDSVPDIDSGRLHFEHLVRWARTIRLCQPVGFAASLIQHGFSLLTLRALLLGPDALGLGLMAGILAAKAASSAWLGSRLGGRQPRAALWLLPLSEWFAFGAWLAGCGSDRVLWRGQLYDVQPRGRLVPVAQPSLRQAVID